MLLASSSAQVGLIAISLNGFLPHQRPVGTLGDSQPPHFLRLKESILSNIFLLTISSDQKLTAALCEWFQQKGIDVVFSLHPRLVLAAAAFNPNGPIRKADVCLFDVGRDEASFTASIASTMDLYGIPVVLMVDEIPQREEIYDANYSTSYLLKSATMSELEESVLAAMDQKAIKLESRNS